jgi:carbon-monoxide dehydrogenase medium subunit
VKVALASVAPTPLIVSEVEDFFNKEDLTEGSITQAAQIAMQACSPIDDVRGSARYRTMMVRNLTQQALTALRAGI